MRKMRKLLLTIVTSSVVICGAVMTLSTGQVLESSTASAMTATKGPVYSLDFQKAKTVGIPVRLKSALLVNFDDGSVLYAKNPNDIRSIASISKLMSAMVLLDKQPDLSQTAVISQQDAYQSSRSRLPVGYKMTLNDFLYTSLMASDNRATRVLARTLYGDYSSFADAMNAKAKQLGLVNTHFVEPTGLDERNVSTATEVAKILYYARQYPLIARITSTQTYFVTALNKRRPVRKQVTNTNLLLHSPYDVLAGKTGYIRASEYCVVSLVQNRQGERLTVVALGARGAMSRFREARKLVDWGFKQL
jgi:serine-type D-Ala-D-Ala endopeptidase (penicillin-binding protein 7)